MTKRRVRRQRGRDRATRPITSSERGKRIRSLLDALPLGAMVTQGMLDQAIAGLLIPTDAAARALQQIGIPMGRQLHSEMEARRLEARLRAIALVQDLFQPQSDAGQLVDDFCNRENCAPNWLYERASAGGIEQHPEHGLLQILDVREESPDGYSVNRETTYSMGQGRIVIETCRVTDGNRRVLRRIYEQRSQSGNGWLAGYVQRQTYSYFTLDDMLERANPNPKPQACQDCRHYLGQTFHGDRGANWLCCAMHPYGPDGECLDWEAAKPGVERSPF